MNKSNRSATGFRKAVAAVKGFTAEGQKRTVPGQTDNIRLTVAKSGGELCI